MDALRKRCPENIKTVNFKLIEMTMFLKNDCVGCVGATAASLLGVEYVVRALELQE